MERRPVSSSNIRSVGYDSGSKTLEIEFHAGGVYQYLNVSPFVYEGMMGAGSKGSYFDKFIKDSYTFRKVS